MSVSLNLPASNFQSISIHQNNLSSVHGIFAFLKELNGKYKTRYSIDGTCQSLTASIDYVDMYYDNPKYMPYWSNNGDPEVLIKFNSTFLLTGYAIVNSIRDGYNSAIEGWNLYGIDSTGQRHLIDSQTGQKFCEFKPNECKCRIETIKGYQIQRPIRGYKNYVLHQTQNSCNATYLWFKALDFFGTLCGINENCSFRPVTCNIKKWYFSNIIFVTIILC